MVWLWGSLAGMGFLLVNWSCLSLPPGTDMMPVVPKKRTRKGPYRWLKHPMYVGGVVCAAGVGGLAAGIWNAIAHGFTVALIYQYFAGLED